MYEKLVASGSVDERTALMLFLLVEKLRGEVRQASSHDPGERSVVLLRRLCFAPQRFCAGTEAPIKAEVQCRIPCCRLG